MSHWCEKSLPIEVRTLREYLTSWKISSSCPSRVYPLCLSNWNNKWKLVLLLYLFLIFLILDTSMLILLSLFLTRQEYLIPDTLAFILWLFNLNLHHSAEHSSPATRRRNRSEFYRLDATNVDFLEGLSYRMNFLSFITEFITEFNILTIP